MKKSALVVYYSHTGQLKEIVKNFVKNWSSVWNVDFMEINTDEYKFPITWHQMFDAMPESVLGLPCKISYPKYDYSSYDLVILGFQPWFMHPSIPFNSFTGTEDFKAAVKNKPVYIITDCRNSRRNAIQIIEEKVVDSGGYIKGGCIFWDDSSGNLIGAFTLLKWLFSGKKNRLFKIFPPAGVRQSIIDSASLYGDDILKKIDTRKPDDCLYITVPKKRKEFTSKGYENDVINMFKKWANYIVEKKQKRKWRLLKFQIWILFAIVFMAPFLAIKNKKYKK